MDNRDKLHLQVKQKQNKNQPTDKSNNFHHFYYDKQLTLQSRCVPLSTTLEFKEILCSIKTVRFQCQNTSKNMISNRADHLQQKKTFNKTLKSFKSLKSQQSAKSNNTIPSISVFRSNKSLKNILRFGIEEKQNMNMIKNIKASQF